MMLKRTLFLFACVLLLSACGAAQEAAPPKGPVSALDLTGALSRTAEAAGQFAASAPDGSDDLLAAARETLDRQAEEEAAQQAQEAAAQQSAQSGGIPGALADLNVPPPEPAVITVLHPVASGTRVERNEYAEVDYSHCEDGYVLIAWTAGGNPRLKVILTGPSGTEYVYDLRNDNTYEVFPLSDGSGNYQIVIYQNLEGTSYATILGMNLNVWLTDEFAAFLRPNQYINYSENSQAVQAAARLCAGRSSNLDKVSAVYNYVVDHISYDTEKAQQVQSGYLPNIDQVYASGKGICFDYAALMTAMLRSQGVPTKLIVGYASNAYHAWINVWNENSGWVSAAIYFDGKSWKLLDPTFASTGGQDDSVNQYIGNGSNYIAKYQY